jgi:hypothetical protein
VQSIDLEQEMVEDYRLELRLERQSIKRAARKGGRDLTPQEQARIAELRETELRAGARLDALRASAERVEPEGANEQDSERERRIAELERRALESIPASVPLTSDELFVEQVGCARLLLRVFTPEDAYERDILAGLVPEEQVIGPDRQAQLARKRRFVCS